jgi:hypothetical protein
VFQLEVQLADREEQLSSLSSGLAATTSQLSQLLAGARRQLVPGACAGRPPPPPPAPAEEGPPGAAQAAATQALVADLEMLLRGAAARLSQQQAELEQLQGCRARAQAAEEQAAELRQQAQRPVSCGECAALRKQVGGAWRCCRARPLVLAGATRMAGSRGCQARQGWHA